LSRKPSHLTHLDRRASEPGPGPKARDKALRLHGTIARKLGISIVSGRVKPGELLNGEIASSEQFEVSRTAYREAVRILAAKGLVDARPKVGTRVTAQSQWNLLDPDVLDWTFESMRAALDGMATHTLATEAGRQADLDFHTALLTATNNPFIISLTNGVNAAIRTTTIFKQRKRPLSRDPIPDHLRVFEAIAAREAENAQQAMSELIELARIDTPAAKRSRRKPQD
jgi:DNA-binding FadR family transcriptional regulator